VLSFLPVAIARELERRRTLQQSMIGVLQKVIIEYAKDEEMTDLRNEASKKWASKVASVTEFTGFPFI
jgi:hypothetical protein